MPMKYLLDTHFVRTRQMADLLRGSRNATDYKGVGLDLIFLKNV